MKSKYMKEKEIKKGFLSSKFLEDLNDELLKAYTKATEVSDVAEDVEEEEEALVYGGGVIFYTEDCVKVYREDGSHYKIDLTPFLDSQPTKLSDLIGDDGQKKVYLIPNIGAGVKWGREFSLRWIGDKWCDKQSKRPSLERNFRWSHDPFTKFEDANEFFFEKEND